MRGRATTNEREWTRMGQRSKEVDREDFTDLVEDCILEELPSEYLKAWNEQRHEKKQRRINMVIDGITTPKKMADTFGLSCDYVSKK